MKDILKEVATGVVCDMIAARERRHQLEHERYLARAEKLKTANVLHRAWIHTVQFGDDLGAMLIPAIIGTGFFLHFVYTFIEKMM